MEAARICQRENIPHFAERGNVALYINYRRRKDGLIDGIYIAREKSVATAYLNRKLANSSTAARSLRRRFTGADSSA